MSHRASTFLTTSFKLPLLVWAGVFLFCFLLRLVACFHTLTFFLSFELSSTLSVAGQLPLLCCIPHPSIGGSFSACHWT
jgi:hypothetical protein